MTSPLTLPQDLMTDQTETEGPVETPYGAVLGAALASSVSQTIENQYIGKVIDKWNETFHESRYLQPNEVKKSYPHVADIFPDGGTEYNVSVTADKKERQLYYQDLMRGMKPGTLRSIGRGTTSLIGAAVAPSNWPAAMAAEMTVGRLGMWAAGKAANSGMLARAAVTLMTGAAEGGVMSIPIQMATRDYHNQIGMPLTPEDTFISTLWMMGLGAAMKTAFGYKKIISNDANLEGAAAVKRQLDNGEQINVKEIVKDGIYQERAMDPHKNPEAIAENLESLKKRLDATNRALETNKKIFEDAAKGKENVLPHTAPKLKTNHLLEQIKGLGDLPDTLLKLEDKALLDRSPNTEEFKTAVTYDKISPNELNKEQTKFLKDFKENEALVTEKGVKRNEKRIEKLKKEIKKTPEPEEASTKKEQLNELKQKIDLSKDRIKTLNNIEKEPVKISQHRESIQELRADKATLENMIKDTESYFDLANAAEPVTEDELAQAAEKVGDWKNKANTYMDEYLRNEKIIERPEIKPEEVLQDLHNEVKELADSNKLNAEELQAYEKAMEMPETNKKTRDAVKSFIECITRGVAG